MERKRILVVEDHHDLRTFYRETLMLAGFEVDEAADGLEALRRLDGNRPDLVVLDLHLPFFSGVEVRHEIANLSTRRIPVVVVSGAPEDLGDVPVDCVLKKPVSPEALVDAVVKCLASHGPLQP